jgi:hypothetical protein
MAELAHPIATLWRGALAFADEYQGGFTNHEPMVLAALAELVPRLGLPRDRPAIFSAAYREKLAPLTDGPAAPVEETAASRGRWELRAGLEAGFAARLAREEPLDVARQALASLGDGLPGAAGHGLLRVAFALAARGLLPDDLFRAELARGLAYFAARWIRLYDGPRGSRPLGEVLAALAPLAPAERAEIQALHQITDRQERVARAAVFRAAVARVDPAEGPGPSLPALARLAARRPDFTLLHALTTGQAILALAELLPGLDRAPLQRGWVDFVVAACLTESLAVADAGEIDPSPVELARDPALVEPLSRTTDDHAIKSAYALVRLEQATGDPSFRAAARSFVAAFG